MRGKLIVIEGTDCSGKETQSKMLVEKLNRLNIKTERVEFPCYESATGKIVGGPLLGKDYILDSYFKEGASNVNPKITSLYYAADRLYNIEKINDLINQGVNVVLDRYTYSNMAFQGAKMNNDIEKVEFFKWIERLEFEMLDLPKSDINVFLHVSVDKINDLLSKRKEKKDGNEKDSNYLKKCEQTYFLLANKYNFKTIECEKNNELRSVEAINEELLDYIKNNI